MDVITINTRRKRINSLGIQGIILCVEALLLKLLLLNGSWPFGSKFAYFLFGVITATVAFIYVDVLAHVYHIRKELLEKVKKDEDAH